MLRLVSLLILLAWVSPAEAYREAEVVSGGSIVGRVAYGRPVPEPSFVPVMKNTAVCGERVRDESLLVSSGGGLSGVVVELLGIEQGKAAAAAPAVLDNEGCAFVPRVQALVVGQSVEIRNSDPVLHDAHAWLGSRTIFNLGLPEWRRVSHEFRDPGLHAIDCNVLHTWMKAWIFVAEHPYVAVTGPEGRFRLEDVPPGTYTLRFWHERLGERTQPVVVEPRQSAVVELSLP